MNEHCTPVWRKARRSDGQAMCVEFAVFQGCAIGVRDSKNPDGTRLVVDTPAWAAFLADTKDGHFDL
jgi:hypothetical protein